MHAVQTENGGTSLPKTRKGLAAGAALIPILTCIFIICVLAVVLGLIPVYIGNSGSSSSSSGTTMSSTSTSTPLSTTAPSTAAADAVTTAGSTDTSAEATILEVDQSKSAKRRRFVAARETVSCDGTLVDIQDLKSQLINFILLQSIRSCISSGSSSVNVTTTCTVNSTHNHLTFATKVNLFSSTIYCSQEDTSNSIEKAATSFKTKALAVIPGAVVRNQYAKTKSQLKFGGTGEYTSTDGNKVKKEFKECFYVNDQEVNNACVTSTRIDKLDKTYKVFGLGSTAKSWPDAQADCMSKGGELANIRNDDNFRKLQALANANIRACSEATWIGFQRNMTTGVVQWLNGNPVNMSSPWWSSAPTNSSSDPSLSTANCGELYEDVGNCTTEYKINTLLDFWKCEYKLAYICEFNKNAQEDAAREAAKVDGGYWCDSSSIKYHPDDILSFFEQAPT